MTPNPSQKNQKRSENQKKIIATEKDQKMNLQFLCLFFFCILFLYFFSFVLCLYFCTSIWTSVLLFELLYFHLDFCTFIWTSVLSFGLLYFYLDFCISISTSVLLFVRLYSHFDCCTFSVLSNRLYLGFVLFANFVLVQTGTLSDHGV